MPCLSAGSICNEFPYPRYCFALEKEPKNEAINNPTLEDTPIANTVWTNVVVNPSIINNATLTPPSNDAGILMPAILWLQAAIQVQAIWDKHAKITELGIHTLEGMALFMSMKDDLLDMWDTVQCSLNMVDPKLAQY